MATNGTDANPGSEAQPWKSLRKAAAVVEPGDTVRIVRITCSSILPAGEWNHVKGAIYSTEVNLPVPAVQQATREAKMFVLFGGCTHSARLKKTPTGCGS